MDVRSGRHASCIAQKDFVFLRLLWVSKPGRIPSLCAFSLLWSSRFTSGVTPADVLAATVPVGPFRSTYLQIMYPPTGNGWGSNPWPKENRCFVQPAWILTSLVCCQPNGCNLVYLVPPTPSPTPSTEIPRSATGAELNFYFLNSSAMPKWLSSWVYVQAAAVFKGNVVMPY